MKTYVFAKNGAETIASSIELVLNTGESIVQVSVGSPTPSGSNFQFSLTSTANPLTFSASMGAENVCYGIPLTVTTNQRVLVVTAAVTCNPTAYDPYPNQDPTSYQQLIGSLGAGKSALATTVFNFDPSFDPSGGYVLWDLVGPDGTIYSSGNAYDYVIRSNGLANTVVAQSVVSVPESIPPSIDAPYQLRYTLRVGNGVAYNYENLTVLGMPDVQLGTSDSAELLGDMALMSLVTENIYTNYVMELYSDSGLLASLTISSPERIANGYYVSASIDTSGLAVTLIPYKVIWKFWNSPNQVFRETANLWIVNPSIMNAVDDVKSKINKARQTLYGTPDSQYSVTELLKWMRRGMDAFNGAFSPTYFTMTKAMGAIREYWLMYAEKAALEAQYGLEAEKAFDYSGAAITLTVDKTQYLDSMIGKLQSMIDNEMKNLKTQLTIKGITSGDGSGPSGDGNLTASSAGSMGSVGITLTPVSIYNAGYSWGTRGF
jgi:hypothetical protein